MQSSSVATIMIVTIIALIFSSLGVALFSLVSPRNNGKRTARALSFRIAISFSLFVGLLFAIYQGWIVPNPPKL